LRVNDDGGCVGKLKLKVPSVKLISRISTHLPDLSDWYRPVHTSPTCLNSKMKLVLRKGPRHAPAMDGAGAATAATASAEAELHIAVEATAAAANFKAAVRTRI
jgi:carbon monoxide dehydrogenase subunit G